MNLTACVVIVSAGIVLVALALVVANVVLGALAGIQLHG